MFVRFLTLSLCLASFKVFATIAVTGAGASFPSPIYSKWSELYYQKYDVQINYQVMGSGGGIKQITVGTVDFAASDKPLSPQQLTKFNLVQFPMVYGAVVPVVNLPFLGNDHLKLDAPLLKKIFLGKITYWSHPEIQALNPKWRIPSIPITVVHRADGAGTTYIFTRYLADKSKEWANRVGSGMAVKWPVGLGGKGNDGVAMYVQSIEGSIGYVEYVYTKNNKGLQSVAMLNRDNHFVLPSISTMSHAVQSMTWDTMTQGVIDSPGINAWPLTGVSYLLLPKSIKPSEVLKYQALLAFITWCLMEGDEDAHDLGYVMNSQTMRNHILRFLKQPFNFIPEDS